MAGRLGHWSNNDGPLYRQLAEAITGLISTGELRHDDRLPPERSFADALAVSRGTVVAAYELLREEGHIERRQGSGTRVMALRSAATIHHRSAITDPLFEAVPQAIDLLKACPEISPRMLDIAANHDLAQYRPLLDVVEPAGLPVLRERIAEYYRAQGMPTSTEQVLVSTGAQQGFALTASLLVKPGDVVITEATTWPGLTDTVHHVGGRVHGLPMDANGVQIDALAAAVERLRPAFIGLNPHHHNPTGSRLSDDRRRAVADIAADFGVPIVEDRVFAPVAFDGVVPPPLAVHRPDANVIVIDSLGKTAWAGLRVGWIRADPQIVHRLRSLKATVDLWTPTPAQLLALETFEQLDDIVRERVEQLRPRAATVIDEVRRRLPEWTFAPVLGGYVVWAQIPHGSASGFARFAGRFGVAVASGREFSASQSVDDHIRLPYALPESVLREAIERLAQAWDAYGESTPDFDGADSRSVI